LRSPASFTAQGVSAPAPIPGTDWSVQQSATADPNASAIVFTTPARHSVAVGADSALPTLVLRCRNGEFAAYAAFGMIADGNGDGTTFIRLRWDNDSSPAIQRWPLSSSAQSVFASDAIAFVGALLKADTLRLAFVPQSQPAVEAVFAVGGLATPALALAHRCPDVGLNAVVASVPAEDQPLAAPDSLDSPIAIVQLTPVRYPEAMQASNVEGEVKLQFVIDTLGRAEPFTIRVLKSNGDAFSRAAKEAIVTTLFKPAVRNGRKVRVVVQQDFTFGLQRRTCRSVSPSACMTETEIQRPPSR
jgi:TonB family protein